MEGLNDSLDLVPVGAWHGNGRKAGWLSSDFSLFYLASGHLIEHCFPVSTKSDFAVVYVVVNSFIEILRMFGLYVSY